MDYTPRPDKFKGNQMTDTKRKCEARGCSKPIHKAYRNDKVYCSPACKVRAHRDSKKVLENKKKK